jgi:hypothetical protein
MNLGRSLSVGIKQGMIRPSRLAPGEEFRTAQVVPERLGGHDIAR